MNYIPIDQYNNVELHIVTSDMYFCVIKFQSYY